MFCLKLTVYHNAFRQCPVRFYASFGQPFSKQLSAETSAGGKRKSDSEVLGTKKFYNSAEATSSNTGGPSENSKKALLLRQ